MKTNNFDRLQSTWNSYGKTEPFWSVLTHDVFKSGNIDNHVLDQFYQSGVVNFQFFEDILNRHNNTFSDKIVLDYGCGVGRLTKAYHRIASSVYGMDVSQPHLDIAKQYDPDSQFFLVDSLDSLPELPKKPNIITSLIVLQHARPDVIKHQVKLLINQLEEDGIALLHIPYDIVGYQEDGYDDGVMEMHCVPKSDILEIIDNNQCNIIEVVETQFCGSDYIKDCVYVIRRIKQ